MTLEHEDLLPLLHKTAAGNQVAFDIALYFLHLNKQPERAHCWAKINR